MKNKNYSKYMRWWNSNFFKKYILGFVVLVVIIIVAAFYTPLLETFSFATNTPIPPEFNVRYDPYDYNITYHTESPGFYKPPEMIQVRVLDKSGKLIDLPYAPSQNLPVYYDVGKYPFGISNHHPDMREVEETKIRETKVSYPSGDPIL
jgi:hypothetical protein